MKKQPTHKLTKKQRAELAKLYQEYQPVRRPMTEDEKARAYAEMQALYDEPKRT